MSGVFCVLIFALLFAIVIVNTTSSSGNEAQNRNTSIRSYQSKCVLYLARNQSGDMCDVYCFRSANLIEEVEEAIADDKICSEIGYHLRYDEPPISTIGPEWFKTNATINKVTIRDVQQYGEILDIEPGAFNDCTFRNMTELVIRRTKIVVLKRGVFEGASSLKKITFEENSAMVHVEENALDALYQLEEMIIILQPQFQNLIYFTGTMQWKQLRTLILNNNNFTTLINADTFRGCTCIEILNLASSCIQTIGSGSFDHIMMETIRSLDLRNNHLKYLSPNSLEKLIKPNMQIYLHNNLFECDCGSFEFQAWLNTVSRAGFNFSVTCHMPLSDQGKQMTNVDLSFCVPNTTTVGLTSSTTSTSVTQPESEELTEPAPPFQRCTISNVHFHSNHVDNT